MKEKEFLDMMDDIEDEDVFVFIRSYLFKRANQFAISGEGNTAVELHHACNELIPVIEKTNPNYFQKI